MRENLKGPRPHSVKLPYLYREAAKVLQAHSEKKGSVKSLVFATHSPKFYNRLLALVSRVIDNAPQLEQLLQDTGLLADNPRLLPSVARVLAAELLWGTGRLPAPSEQCQDGEQAGDTGCSRRPVAKPVATLLAYADRLRKLAATASASASDTVTAAPYSAAAVNHGNTTTAATPTIRPPRYVRVNTLKTTVQAVLQELADDGWRQAHYHTTSLVSFITTVKSLQEDQFAMDIHVPDLLVFAAGTNFSASEAYQQGRIVLQDKASCLPALLLSPPEGSVVIDACAAPGMKTSHLAALMNNTGSVLAVEMDAARLKTLNTMLAELGVTNCRTVCSDFMKIQPSDHPDCTHILLDPSCSGSGMWQRSADEQLPDSYRLQRLANMQAMLLRHALSFPSARRVVYSTCSQLVEENEQVVGEALTCNPQWKLARVSLTPWRAFGEAEHLSSWQRCLRTTKQHDLCCGFFVCVFRRRKNSEKRAQPMNDGNATDITDSVNQSECAQVLDEQPIRKKRKKHKSK